MYSATINYHDLKRISAEPYRLVQLHSQTPLDIAQQVSLVFRENAYLLDMGYSLSVDYKKEK